MAGPLDAYVGDVGYDPGLVAAPRPVEQTGFFDNIVAGYRAARAGPASTALHQNAFEAPLYDQVVNALNARGETTTDPLHQGFEGYRSAPRAYRNPLSGRMPLTQDNPYAWQQAEATNIWAAVARVRQTDPDFLKDLPDNQALTARAISDRRGQLADAEQVTDRASTLGKIGGFLGGLGAAPFEPETYVGGFGGGGAAGKVVAKTVVRSALSSSAQNVVGALVGTPGQAADAADLGIDMTTGDILHNIGTQAVAGALLGGAHAVAPQVLAAGGKIATKVVDASLDHLPEPMKMAAIAASIRAGTVGDRASTIEARRLLDPYGQLDTATPDEKAAFQVSDRDADVREASPLHPDPVAAGAHDSRLAAMEQWLGVANAPADVPTPAPLPAVPTGGNLTTAINRAEGTGRNPNSSAEGVGQFLESTWLDVYKRNFGGDGMTDAQILALRHDPAVGAQMTAIYGRENAAGLRRAGLEDSPGNVSLAHFLGLAGARDVLKAAPDTPIEGLLPEKVIAANEKVLRGKSAGDVIEWAHKRIGNATGMPVARGDAVPHWDPETDSLPDDAPEIPTVKVRPDDVEAGPLQSREGAGADGVTGALADETEFNRPRAGALTIWEDEDGRRVVVDGHQRLDLAKRTGEPTVDAMVLREADGISADQAREIGRLKNEADRLPEHADVRAMAQLSNGDLGAVLNGEPVPMTFTTAKGSIYRVHEDGSTTRDKSYHPEHGLADQGVQPRSERTVYVDAGEVEKLAPFQAIGGEPRLMFDDSTGHIGIMDEAGQNAGKMLSGTVVEARRQPAVGLIPVESWRSGKRVHFGNEITEIRNGERSDRAVSGASGREDGSAQADSGLADRRGVSGGTTPYADAIVAQRVGERFSDPVEGPGIASQIQSLEHDLGMHPPEGTFRLSEDGAEQSIGALLKDAESDLSAVEKARACLAPPKLDTAA